MAIIVPEGFCNVTMIWTCVGSVKDKTTAIGMLSLDIGDPSASDIADLVYANLIGTGKPCASASMSTQYTFEGVSVTKTVSGLPVLGQHLVAHPGTATLPPCPSNTSLLIKKQTTLGGRKGRGRMFVPPFGVQEVEVDASGFIGSTILGINQGYWSSFLTDLGSDDLDPYLFHSDATAPSLITGLSIESQVATQRRRMR